MSKYRVVEMLNVQMDTDYLDTGSKKIEIVLSME